MSGIDPPRGLAFAWFKIGNEDIGVYSIHLKSNLITRGDKEAETAKNVRKREVAITQLLTHIRDVIGTRMPTIKGVVIGGDFNTNRDQAMFAAERTLDALADAGYQNGFERLPLSERVTHPGTHGFPDATFDFIFAKGLTASQPTITRTIASDHWPVTRSFALH
jgi:endonuclease/exonuclease/phosphatase (EEP) superfamily protein YafD